MSTSQATVIPDTGTYTRIHDPHTLKTARIGWIILVAVALVVKIALQPYIAVESAASASFYSTQLTQLGLSESFYVAYSNILSFVVATAYVVTALFIFWRRSDAGVPLFIALGLALYGLQVGAFYVTVIQDPLLLITFALLRFITNVVINTAIFIFPDGRFSIRWMRWLLIGYIIVDGIRIAVLLLEPRVGNAEEMFAGLRRGLFYLSLVPAVGAVWSQIYRYRHTVKGVQRQQLKWIVFGIAAAVLVEIAIPIVFGNEMGVLGVMIADTVVTLFQLVLPVAVAFAILRYRLYDIDLLINRSLVYGLVTLLMAVVFLGGAFILQSLLGREQSGIALAVGLLGAGAVFNPARKRVQNFIDRRFYRLRFNLNELAAAQQTSKVTNPGFLTGRILDGYEVLDVVGRGGMGEVYKGVGHGKTVAIKTLPADMAQKSEFRLRFTREAEALSHVHHPNIVKMYGSGECEGLLYMAMEFVEGQELGEIIREMGRLSIANIRPFAADFAAALDYAHAHGLVHRDIKPSNIMIRQKADGETQEAVLMDFGVAKIQDARTSITGTSAIGTIDYMAPEQITDAKDVDHCADIYALGVVLYEMLTGERPFKGAAPQVLFAHLHQPAPDPRDLVPDLVQSVAEAIMKAMAKQPKDRFQSVGALADALA
jgi:serine/threonine-protein kinase